MRYKYVGDPKRVTTCQYKGSRSFGENEEDPCINGCPGNVDGECPFTGGKYKEPYPKVSMDNVLPFAKELFCIVE